MWAGEDGGLPVSITRGRAKTVVCLLPRPLLDATPTVLEDDEAAEGLAYMRQLLRLLETHGEVERFLLSDGVSVDVYRAIAPLRVPSELAGASEAHGI